jgi:ribokinase
VVAYLVEGLRFMPDVIALGDLNVDIIAHFTTYPAKGEDALAHLTEIHCGGSAANTAMGLARMGIETSLIARVGPDSWALKALHALNEAGVVPTSLQRDPAAMTGLMYVIVTPDGERTILGHRGANVFTDSNQIREEEIKAAILFHISGYALLAEPQRSAALLALEMACRNGLTVTLDPGMSLPQAALDELRALLPVVNILLPNLAEARQLTGLRAPEDCIQALLDKGVQVVGLKLDREGCIIGNDGGFLRVPAFAVETRDSTGAGDSFAAGFIAGFLGGLDWVGAAVLGNVMGAIAAARVGAATAFPKAREVLALLGEHYHEPTHCDCLEAIRQAIDYVTTLATEPAEEGKPWWR